MVKVVVAGGSGNVAREIIDELLRGKHQITVFTRSNPDQLRNEGLDVVQVDYTNKADLVQHLQGIDVVLSFIVVASDPGNIAQRTLIDACLAAGVKRFAPNEWSTRSNSGVSWYEQKDEVLAYLRGVNKDFKKLEYTLFQPGLFLNYLSFPYSSGTHFHNTEIQYSFQQRRALIVAGGGENDVISWTTVQDLARIVRGAVEYEGVWPETGGLRGGRMSVGELVRLGEGLRGKPWTTTHIPLADLESGILKTDWIPTFTHPNVPLADLASSSTIPGEAPPDPQDAFSRLVVIGSMLAIHRGVWDVSNEWNKLLPKVKMTSVEEFIRHVWEGKE
ncbi:nmrA-like family protein-like protein [Tricladium varicosporioides]|nr:nmrA-like family protein-like protein [Hymenoscyphus varicosporioides]